MFNRLKVALQKYRTAWFMFVVFTTCATIDRCEDIIMRQVVITSIDAKDRILNYSCPHVTNREHHMDVDDSALFYWSESQKQSMKIIQVASPLFSILFGGVYSDRYGGHRVVLVALVMAFVAMSTLYLSVTHNNYVIIGMISLRKACDGLIWVGFISLSGKLASSDERTTFAASLLSAKYLGRAIADVALKSSGLRWRMLSQIGGFFSFIAAVWWWMICKYRLPKVRRYKEIPWRKMVKYISLYSVCLLYLSLWFLQYMAKSKIVSYAEDVIFINLRFSKMFLVLRCTTLMFGFLFCGFSSDYFITKRLLSTSVVRKGFYGLSLVILFFVMVVLKISGCNKDLVAVVCIGLNYAQSLANPTALAAIMDFSPRFSGVIFAIATMFVNPAHFTLNTLLLDNIFISGNSKGDVNKWSLLLMSTAFLAFLFSVPFLYYNKRKTLIEIKTFGSESIH